MRIIVHAGMPKTGTSAIQEYLYSVRAEMLEQGIVYPDLEHASHWRLAVALAPDTLIRKDAEAAKAGLGYLSRRAANQEMDVEETLEATTRAIQSAPADGTVILSHENFSAPRRAAQLVEYLGKVAPSAQVEAIVYVRNPVALYPSGVQQSMKAKGVLTPPTQWLSTHPGRTGGVGAAFGEERTEVRAHDRSVLAGGDIIEDFREYAAQRIGVQLPPAPQALSTNESMSAPVCAMLMRYRKGPGGESLKVYSELRRALMQFSRNRKDPKLRLPEGWDAALAFRNGEGWNQLVARMPYGEDVKARLCLSVPQEEPEPLRVRDVRVWIRSYLTPEFIEEFRAYLADTTAVRPDRVKKWQAWLAEQAPPAD